MGTGVGTHRSYIARDEDKRLLKGWSEEEEALHIPGIKRENISEAERGGGGGHSTKGGGGGWGVNDYYKGEYHCRHPPYFSSSRIEADAAEDMTSHLEEVSER